MRLVWLLTAVAACGSQPTTEGGLAKTLEGYPEVTEYDTATEPMDARNATAESEEGYEGWDNSGVAPSTARPQEHKADLAQFMALVDNCTDCELPPAALKYNPKPLGAPVLEFPQPVAPFRAYASFQISLSEGMSQFRYLRQFLSYIQPYDFPVELVRDYLKDRISVTKLLTKAIHVEIGFLCCILVGLCASLTAPGVALGRLCYRISHETPTSEPGCMGNCKRRTLLFLVEILLALMLLGVSGMLVANEQLSNGLSKAPNLTEAVIQDGLTFIQDSQSRIEDAVTGSLERAVQAASSDLDNVENLLGRPIQTELARETGLDVALESLMDIERETRIVYSQVETLIKDSGSAETLIGSTRERLWELRHQIESTLRHCQSRDRPLCDTITVQGLDVRFTTHPITNDNQLAFLKNLNSNLSLSVAEATTSFQTLPSSVEKETKEARQNVLRQVQRHKALLTESLKTLESFTRELSYKVAKSKDYIMPNFSSIEQANFWIWLVGLGAGLSVLQVWILLLGAISCGCCGAEKSSVPTLITTVVLVSVLSLCLWLLALAALVVGGHGEVFLCRPLYEDSKFQTLTKLTDEAGVFNTKKGGFVSNFLYENSSFELPLGEILENCHQNKSVYTTFCLKHILDIDNATDLSKWEALKEKLNQINVNLLNFQILTPSLYMHLKDLFNGLAVNLTSLRVQLSGPITNKDLESFAHQLDSVSSQVSDLSIATHLETLASRSRRIITSHIDNLEEQKERLIYQLTALELKVGPLQRQVNQSLSHLKTIQYFINNQWSSIAHQSVKDYRARLLNYFEQFRKHVLKTLNSDATTCKPLWELYNATRLLLCRHIVDPINGFWFATMWCLILFLVATPVSLKLTDYYSQYNNFMGDVSPSEMFLHEEQHSGWSTPGQREGDGW